MSVYLVNVAGVLLIGGIVWWFWIKQPRATHQAQGPIEVIVQDGVYSPARIQVPRQKPVTLRFIRKDPSPCAQKVIFAELDKAVELPLDEPTDVTVTAPRAGEYSFTCDMQMYRGTLVAR